MSSTVYLTWIEQRVLRIFISSIFVLMRSEYALLYVSYGTGLSLFFCFCTFHSHLLRYASQSTSQLANTHSLKCVQSHKRTYAYMHNSKMIANARSNARLHRQVQCLDDGRVQNTQSRSKCSGGGHSSSSSDGETATKLHVQSTFIPMILFERNALIAIRFLRVQSNLFFLFFFSPFVCKLFLLFVYFLFISFFFYFISYFFSLFAVVW